jgi:pimeloyl-ACP methyl ester carboxylesterase
VAAVVEAVAARTGRPVTLFGHSYGAGTAMGGAALTGRGRLGVPARRLDGISAPALLLTGTETPPLLKEGTDRAAAAIPAPGSWRWMATPTWPA